MAEAGGVIEAAELRDRLAGVEPIGRGADGTTRLAWTPELAAAEARFADQARATGLRVERDPAGTLSRCDPVAHHGAGASGTAHSEPAGSRSTRSPAARA